MRLLDAAFPAWDVATRKLLPSCHYSARGQRPNLHTHVNNDPAAVHFESRASRMARSRLECTL